MWKPLARFFTLPATPLATLSASHFPLETDFLVYMQGSLYCVEIKNLRGQVYYPARYRTVFVEKGWFIFKRHVPQVILDGYDFSKMVQQKMGDHGEGPVTREMPNPIHKTQRYIDDLKRYLYRMGEFPDERRAPLSRKRPTWVPAAEVRGEGLFLEFREEALQAWLSEAARRQHNRAFHEAHTQWRRRRRREFPEQSYPGLRYVLLHSFAHALMRQLALESGYTAASIRERIYALEPEHDDGPMAGVLLYTSAPDSEGTLGGLVSLGAPDVLGRLIEGALEQMQRCTSDPLCAEHSCAQDQSLHQAACHACLFLPETSCKRGNKYLDRSVLVPTVDRGDLAFFFS